MNFEHAIKCIKEKIGLNPVTGKPIPIYPNNFFLKCLNSIISAATAKRTTQLENNRLFMKVFIMLLEREIFRTGDYHLAINAITTKLRWTPESHIKQFAADMHLHSFAKACEMLGVIEADYTKGLKPSEAKEIAKKNAQTIKTHEANLKKQIISDHWSYDKAEHRLRQVLASILTDKQFLN